MPLCPGCDAPFRRESDLTRHRAKCTSFREKRHVLVKKAVARRMMKTGEENNQVESPKKGKVIGNQQSRPQGSPANQQQRKPAKKKGGLVIGSSSKFSQSPKQADEKPVQKVNKQDSSVSPAKVPTKSRSPGQGCKQP